MNICVVALGKIGLPLAVQCASKGHSVIGVDVNSEVVDLVNRGVEPFPGETDLARKLGEVLTEGLLRAVTETTEAVQQSQVVLVVVPLVVDDEGVPEFRAMDAATQSIAKGLRPGTLVSYETTLPLGTTRERFTPALEAGSGLRAGTDFFVCHSPERVYSGRIFADLRRYPKIVGGIDDRSARLAVEFYESILDFDQRDDLTQGNGVWDVGSAEAAEFAKLAETTYRDVNIALANTFARHADRIGVDVHRVIEAANSQPFSHIHRPGIAVGGHCIPVYPRFYLTNDPSADVVRAGRETNDSMPAHAVSAIAARYGPLRGLTVAVLGAAYRGGVKETAFSGIFGLLAALRDANAEAVVHDPLYADEELRGMGMTPYHLGDPCDVAIIQSDHQEYRRLVPEDLPGVRCLYDGRDCISASFGQEKGVSVIRLGTGDRRTTRSGEHPVVEPLAFRPPQDGLRSDRP